MKTLIIPEPRPQPRPWAVKLCGGGPRGRVCLLMQAGANCKKLMELLTLYRERKTDKLLSPAMHLAVQMFAH